ncbi:MAG: aldose epimerase family protein, partial [Pseudomonadota bacterium]
NGLAVDLVNVGAGIAGIRVPTKSGEIPVVLGYANADDYLNDTYAMGSTCGRFANRIRRGRFQIDGETYQVDVDPEIGHSLHGGRDGFQKKLWTLAASSPTHAQYRLTSPDNDCGFPGELAVQVDYTLSEAGTLSIEFEATTDAPTIVNLANHAYFNLHGPGETIEGHHLHVVADQYTEIDDDLVPTGTIASTAPAGLDLSNEMELQQHRFDHNFVITGYDGSLREVAQLFSPKSSIRLTVRSTLPGLQVYTSDSLGAPFSPREGICLEAQQFPDAPNHASFPSTIVRPGHTYRSTVEYTFHA